MDFTNASHDDTDKFNQLSTGFLNWFTSTGSSMSGKIKLTDLREQSAGRGIELSDVEVALQDIEEGEELFSIPRSAILTPTTSSVPKDVLSSLDNPWHKLILAMIFESQQQASSKWAPYLEILPTQFDTLMFWTEEELVTLKGSAVVEKIGKQSADQTFSDELIPILRKHSAAFDVDGVSDQDLLVMCHRMGSTIMSYAFDIEQSSPNNEPEQDEWEVASDDEADLPVGMIPMADMLNANADRNNAKLFYEEDKVSMRSIQYIAKGSEIFNDYGPIPTADLLRRYGYVTDNYSQYDVVEIGQGLVTEVMRAQLGDIKEDDVARRLRYLDKHEIPVDAFDISRASTSGHGIPESLIIFVKLMTAEAAAFDEMKKQSSLPDAQLESMSRPNLQLLSTVLVKRRSQYSSQVLTDDDWELMILSSEKGETQTQRRSKMALQVICGEKQILQDAFDKINQILERYDTKRSHDDFEESAREHQNTQKRAKR